MDSNNKKDYKQEVLYKALYSYIGYHHVENINDKIDESIEDIDYVKTPESLDKWFANYNKDLENEKRKDKSKAIFKSITSKVAMVFIILFISISALTVSVEAFRIRLFNMIIENTEKYMEIEVQEESEVGDKTGDKIDNKIVYDEPRYIPDGFEIDSVTDLGNTKIINYTNQNNEEITFQKSPNGTNFQIDSEDAMIEELDVMGTDVIMISKEGMTTLFWHNDEHSFYLLSTIEQEELISMLKSLIEK